jgi:xanthine dehydrogenase accessory factor
MRPITVAIRGSGEMATGIARRLFVSGFTNIVMSEIDRPVAVRRAVAFSEAVYEGQATVEGVTAKLITDMAELERVWATRSIAVIVDERADFAQDIRPDVFVDATMVKRPKGILKGTAPLVIGVGPGFTAPDQVDAVVESNRGHDLGRVIYEGQAESYTGVPGTTAGVANDRVIRSPHAGMVRPVRGIGETVEKGDLVLYVGNTGVTAAIGGILRGLIRPIGVPAHEKLGDIDPRGKREYCHTISDKARAIGGGVLEAIMHKHNAHLR